MLANGMGGGVYSSAHGSACLRAAAGSFTVRPAAAAVAAASGATAASAVVEAEVAGAESVSCGDVRRPRAVSKEICGCAAFCRLSRVT